VTAGLIVAGFVLIAFGSLREATDPAWQDTEGYLGHSLYIAEHGGWLGFLREAFAGTFPITERHPLYMLLLAPFAARDAQFFWNAKLINVVLGTLVLISLMWMVNRRYGRGPALIAGSLYAVSRSLVVASSHVNNEPIFVLCALWTWWWLTSPDGSVGRWALAGLCAGLAFLAKSPGTLIIVATIAASLWHSRGRALGTGRFWVFALVAGLIGSPLFVRNLRGYGTPLYEGVNTYIMWMDEWSELGDPASIIFYDPYGVHTIERNALPTAATYFQTHTWKDVARRLARGYVIETRVAAKALAPEASLPTWIRVPWGAAALALGVAGWWAVRRTWEGALLFLWAAAFLTFFGWDAKLFPDIRYLATLIPLLLAYAAWVCWRGLSRSVGVLSATRASHIASLVVVGAAVGWTIASGRLTKPQPVLGGTPAHQRLMAWFDQALANGGSTVLGPTKEFYGLLWSIRAPVKVYQTPNVSTREAFLGYFADRGITHLIVHPENIRGINGKLAGALAPHWSVSPEGGMIEREPLPGWNLVYRDPGTPSRFLVYRPQSQGGPG
jgi:4-amino-4-deoxy-L-arabinose transferase-like glycosyltransferase